MSKINVAFIQLYLARLESKYIKGVDLDVRNLSFTF